MISVDNTPVTAVSRNPAAHGAAKIKVDYTPKVARGGQGGQGGRNGQGSPRRRDQTERAGARANQRPDPAAAQHGRLPELAPGTTAVRQHLLVR